MIISVCRYTMKSMKAGEKAVYAYVLDWPKGNVLKLAAPIVTESTKITLLGYSQPFTYTGSSSGVTINIPVIDANNMPCDYAWILKMTDLSN